MHQHVVDVAATPTVKPKPAEAAPAKPEREGRSIDDLRQEAIEKAQEFIEDLIVRLDPYAMQDLVAGILQAMGYKTRVSPKGSDRGVDIFASPDGLGLQEPRIFVEVKHRATTQIGAPEVRAFLGGRRPTDRCLYVSTGGFSREARYEADRANVPLHLVDMPELPSLQLIQARTWADDRLAGPVHQFGVADACDLAGSQENTDTASGGHEDDSIPVGQGAQALRARSRARYSERR